MILEWVVRSDQIDLDRWARAVISALSAGKHDPRGALRWWLWPLSGFLAVALGMLTGAWMVVATLGVPLLLGVGLAVGLKLTGTRRLARQLKGVPSSGEGFTLVADPTGTSRTGPGGSDRLPWRRYRAARLDDDVITLLLDNKTVTVLPIVALESAHEPGDAVALINDWIGEL